MSMMRFGSLFPELAAKETRTAVLFPPEDPSIAAVLPTDEYGFDEWYCADPGCDCRRVLLHVYARYAAAHMATISHAFDPPKPDSHTPEQTFLDPVNPQSSHAPSLLELFVDMVLPDKAYLARLERHYQMFKAAVNDPDHPCQTILRKGGLGVQSDRILPPPPRRGKRKWR